MEGWIVLNILCHTEESYQKEELGIKLDDEDLEFNPYDIQISQIGIIGANPDINGSFITVGGRSLESKESPKKIKELIIEDSYIRKQPLNL